MVEIETALETSMKIACPKEGLVSALSVVSRAVSTRSTVQVLSGILLQAQGDRVELAATDMELSVRLGLDAQVEGGGAVVAPGRLLVDLVRLLPDAEVTLEHKAEEGVLQVVSGPSSSRLHTYSAE